MIWKYWLLGGVIGLFFVGAIGIVFALIMLVYALAKMNIFFTIVEEGQVKVILKFGKFHRAVMSYTDHDFRRNRPNEDFTEESLVRFSEPDYWDVLRLKRKEEREQHFAFLEQFTPERFSGFFKNLGGLKWVGIPFVHTVRVDRLDWASSEQVAGPGGKGVVDELVPNEQVTDRILVQEDVYGAKVPGSETKDLVAMDSILLYTVAVINPRKAVSRVQHWLESTLNQTRPRYVEFLRTKTYDEVVGGTAITEESVMAMLGKDTDGHPGILKRLRDEYGVDVRKVQVPKIDPSPNPKVDFAEQATLNFVAEKQAKATVTRAEAEAKRIKLVSSEIKKQGGIGRLVVTLDALKGVDKLTVLSRDTQLLNTLQVAAMEEPTEPKEKGGAA